MTNLLEDIFKDLKKRYAFLHLSEEELENINEQTISKINLNQEEKALRKDYSIIFMDKIRNYILEKNEKENYFRFYFDNYIFNEKMSSFAYIKKISAFFHKLKIKINFNFIENLLKTIPNFYNIIHLIVEEHKDIILKGGAYQLYNDDLFLNIIDVYCCLESLEVVIDDEDKSAKDEQKDNTDLSAERQFIKEIYSIPLLSKEEERSLLEKAKNNDRKAINKLVEHNLRLIKSIAQNYVGGSLTLNDLIQEGSIGFIKAMEKFDLNKGTSLTTYATFWIRNSINQARSSENLIREPTSVYKKRISYENALEEVSKTSKTTNIEKEVEEKTGLNKEQILKIINGPKIVASLNQPTKNEKDSEIGDFLEDKDFSLEKEVFEKNDDVIEALYNIILNSNLSLNQQKALLFRYGLDNSHFRSLEEVGALLGVTRERVRQIEAKALRIINVHSKALTKDDNFYLPLSNNPKISFIFKGKTTLSQATKNKIILKCLNYLLKTKNINKTDYEIFKLRYGINLPKEYSFKSISKSYSISYFKVYESLTKVLEAFAIIKNMMKNNLDKTDPYNKISVSYKVNNFYEYFSNCSEEEINFMLNLLSDEERELVYLRYGESLSNNYIDTNYNISFYRNLMPKMKLFLAKIKRLGTSNIDMIIKPRDFHQVLDLTAYFSEYTPEEINLAISFLNEKSQNIFGKIYKGKLKCNSLKHKNLTKEEIQYFKSSILPKLDITLASIILGVVSLPNNLKGVSETNKDFQILINSYTNSYKAKKYSYLELLGKECNIYDKIPEKMLDLKKFVYLKYGYCNNIYLDFKEIKKFTGYTYKKIISLYKQSLIILKSFVKSEEFFKIDEEIIKLKNLEI